MGNAAKTRCSEYYRKRISSRSFPISSKWVPCVTLRVFIVLESIVACKEWVTKSGAKCTPYPPILVHRTEFDCSLLFVVDIDSTCSAVQLCTEFNKFCSALDWEHEAASKLIKKLKARGPPAAHYSLWTVVFVPSTTLNPQQLYYSALWKIEFNSRL